MEHTTYHNKKAALQNKSEHARKDGVICACGFAGNGELWRLGRSFIS
jgi:hypothetical protein